MKTFGENLEKLLQSRNLTVAQLARALGLPAKTVTEWVGDGGRTPRNTEHLKKLADYFGCTIHFLLFGEEDPRSVIGNLLDKTELHTGLYEITIRRVKHRRLPNEEH